MVTEGHQLKVTLSEVYLAPQLLRIIISYGKLELNGFFGLDHNGANRVLARRRNGETVFDISMKSNILYVKNASLIRSSSTTSDLLMATMDHGTT